MNDTAGRFEVRLISAQALAQYMEFRGLSNQALAELMGKPAYRSTISHLRSGHRKTCRPETARKLEKALNAPPGSLFVPVVPNAGRGIGRAA